MRRGSAEKLRQYRIIRVKDDEMDFCAGCELQISQAYWKYVKKAAGSRRRKGVRQPLRDIVRYCLTTNAAQEKSRAALLYPEKNQAIAILPLATFLPVALSKRMAFLLKSKRTWLSTG